MKTLRVYFMEGCFVCVCDQFLDLREDISVKVKVKLGLLRTNYFRKVLPAKLVTIFKLSIVVSLLLDSIIRQMDKLIADIVERVFSATSSYVAFLVAIAFETTIDACQESKAPEIKLASVH